MNPHLDGLKPYPFERLNALLEGLSPNPSREPVALSLGEPKHDAPDFVVAALPGSYLGRTQNGVNPGAGRIRIALVAPLTDCLAAARRLADFVKTHDFG